MEVAVFLDHKFSRTPDGRVWSMTMFGQSFWARYLEVFSKVQVVARIRLVDGVPSGAQCVSSELVKFSDMPFYEGPWEYFQVRTRINKLVVSVVRSGRAVILRLPQTIPFQAYHVCKKFRVPFGVEIVADPWDSFSPGAVKHPARSFFRRYYSRELRNACRDAEATSYVTSFALQNRYPPTVGKFTQGVSGVEIDEVLDEIRDAKSFQVKPLKCIFVGALNQLYKAQDILIESVGCVIKAGIDIELRIVGDGKFRPFLESLAKDVDAADKITFLGELAAGDDVIRQLDQADLFLLPSRQEGLPRALIEAMARGLPAIASNVGGIGELLSEGCLVEPNSVRDLTLKICDFVKSPKKLSILSKENLTTAKKFIARDLNLERRKFYENVRSRFEKIIS